MFNILLYFFMAFGIIAASYAVNTSSVVRAVFAMFAVFFSVSALLIFNQADFLAISHLMIYIGGIIVLMVFAIMLSSKNSISDENTGTEIESTAFKFTKRISGLACLFLFALMANVILKQQLPKATNGPRINSIEQIGEQLLSTYAMPLEIISLLLLVALMAASIIIRKEKQHV